ncbi:MAG: thiol peroxidase [Spirochaetales bacterium]
MATTQFKGTQVNTVGSLPREGDTGADFLLTTGELKDVTLADYAGKKKVINIVPSLDTGVCAESARRFNKEIKAIGGTVVLTVSRDLPFAQNRFCEANNIDEVVTLSELRNREFGTTYGVEMADGPLAGLLARAVVVLDENNKVIHAELVPEIANEPNYEAALRAVR